MIRKIFLFSFVVSSCFLFAEEGDGVKLFEEEVVTLLKDFLKKKAPVSFDLVANLFFPTKKTENGANFWAMFVFGKLPKDVNSIATNLNNFILNGSIEPPASFYDKTGKEWKNVSQLERNKFIVFSLMARAVATFGYGECMGEESFYDIWFNRSKELLSVFKDPRIQQSAYLSMVFDFVLNYWVSEKSNYLFKFIRTLLDFDPECMKNGDVICKDRFPEPIFKDCAQKFFGYDSDYRLNGRALLERMLEVCSDKRKYFLIQRLVKLCEAGLRFYRVHHDLYHEELVACDDSLRELKNSGNVTDLLKKYRFVKTRVQDGIQHAKQLFWVKLHPTIGEDFYYRFP
ncbi:MAG: hypothetical protein JW725_02895 [Candidatus Babeliaceae bacterium]|nr:hypothetical protein [Candidatus Babeliaceae bacterium]